MSDELTPEQQAAAQQMGEAAADDLMGSGQYNKMTADEKAKARKIQRVEKHHKNGK